MPALEIMPQCPNREEAQRRASGKANLPYQAREEVVADRSPGHSPRGKNHRHHSSPNKSPTQRLARFFRKSLSPPGGNNNTQSRLKSQPENHNTPNDSSSSLNEFESSFSSMSFRHTTPRIPEETLPDDIPEALRRGGPIWSD